MALATMFVTLPFIVRELIPTLEQMDLAQEEAAKTLGANPLQVRFCAGCFRRVLHCLCGQGCHCLSCQELAPCACLWAVVLRRLCCVGAVQDRVG
jgi:hypothetical protein